MRHRLNESLAAAQIVSTAMEMPTKTRIISGDQTFTKLHSGIELQDVDFSYNGGSEVLQGTCFGIEADKMTAIVGASGAGKTTLIDLLLRF